MPAIYKVDEKNRLEVDYRHFYSTNCRCMACLQMFLAVSDGVVKVVSQDGTKPMTFPPHRAARTWQELPPQPVAPK